jgi:hypothetical protein
MRYLINPRRAPLSKDHPLCSCSKIEAIASELSECGDARTRRQTAGKLKEIIEGIQNVGSSKTIHYDGGEVTHIFKRLGQIN